MPGVRKRVPLGGVLWPSDRGGPRRAGGDAAGLSGAASRARAASRASCLDRASCGSWPGRWLLPAERGPAPRPGERSPPPVAGDHCASEALLPPLRRRGAVAPCRTHPGAGGAAGTGGVPPRLRPGCGVPPAQRSDHPVPDAPGGGGAGPGGQAVVARSTLTRASLGAPARWRARRSPRSRPASSMPWWSTRGAWRARESLRTASPRGSGVGRARNGVRPEGRGRHRVPGPRPAGGTPRAAPAPGDVSRSMSLARAQVRSAPARSCEAVPGLELVELGGGRDVLRLGRDLQLTEPVMAQRLLERKGPRRRHGAGTVVTANRAVSSAGRRPPRPRTRREVSTSSRCWTGVRSGGAPAAVTEPGRPPGRPPRSPVDEHKAHARLGSAAWCARL